MESSYSTNALTAASTHANALQRLQAVGWQPRAVFDIGAFQGQWSEMAAEIFPNADYVLFEANADNGPEIRDTGYQYFIVALSGADGIQRPFFIAKNVVATGASLYRENTVYFAGDNAVVREVTTASLDTVVEVSGLPPPDLIKLDVQGSELDVLTGGKRTVARCDALIIETSILPYNEGAPLFAEVVSVVDKLGFKCVDICQMLRSGASKALTQIDLLFVRDALYQKYCTAAGLPPTSSGPTSAKPTRSISITYESRG
jgi:FkbM family methyltransferase